MAPGQTQKESSPQAENEQLPTPPPELEESMNTEQRTTKSVVSLTATVSNQKPVLPPSAKTCEFGCTEDDCEHQTKDGDESEDKEATEKKDSSDKQSTDESESSKSEKKDEEKSKEGEKSKDDPKADDKDEKKDEKDTLPRGMKTGVKLLWAKTDAQCKCCTVWQEKREDDNNLEESDECLQHAIVVRKKRKHEGNRKPLKVDSIVVHSPLLKRVLHKIFAGYPDLMIDLDELIFEAPFAPFFHRWEEFEKAIKEESDELTKSHLQLLYDALEGELRKPIQRHKDLVRHNAIDFDSLWTLFTPGTLMYSHDDGQDRLYETDDCEYWQDFQGSKFTVRCQMIEWDGENFGKVQMCENFKKFKGTRQITTLPSYPLRFHQKADEIMKKCVKRGKRFQELAGTSCKDYKGTAIEYVQYGMKTVETKRNLEGRVMLDESMFQKFNPDEVHDLRELDEDEEDTKKGQAEAAVRLSEQAKQAVEALKKAEEEKRKKKEEEEQKAQAEKEKVGEEKPEGEKKDKEEPTVEPQETITENEKCGETEQGEKEPEKTTKTEENETPTEISATPEDPAEEKKGSSTSSTSDESEGIPTPESETEEPEEDPKSFSKNEKQEFNDHQLAICNAWLRGYSLTFQKWCAFAVSNISDVAWNDDAFSELTLPAEYRELILATIQSQIRQNQWKQKMEKVDKEQKPLSALRREDGEGDVEEDNPTEFDDFIAKKGLGYIMLFSGNPGVGKTATAESIAELLHVPLYIISVGNLGTCAESVESSLQDTLELASKWNAVLLLDEADIFLEQRTKHDLHRNAVVSVFLRLLEYYQGVLCLTTNRSEEIDVAFHSRIHLSLPFPDLNETNREQIWRHFAKVTNKRHEGTSTKRNGVPAPSSSTPVPESDASMIGSKTTEQPTPAQDPHHPATDSLIDLSNSDFRKLSQSQLNGRQIKNAFKTAVLLASYKKEKVQMKHVKTALKTIDGNGLGKREVGGMYY